MNGPWLLGYGTAAQNPVPAITRTGVIGRGYRSLPFAAPVRAPRPASEQLLDRLELEEEQPVADEGHAVEDIAAYQAGSPIPADGVEDRAQAVDRSKTNKLKSDIRTGNRFTGKETA